MYKILRADKDTYITNKIISGERQTSANVGGAGTLDLFKLYGQTFSGSQPNVELSRLLIHFDLTSLRHDVEAGKIDMNDASFKCYLKLKDVYGGQPTPSNFTVDVFPLSSSFSEGTGRDIVKFSDHAVCNYLSSTLSTPWIVPGCMSSGSVSDVCDFVTGSMSLGTLKSSQTFVQGDENLKIDVTKIVSATLTNQIPDAGFRISFTVELENDAHTYFVKRFASRHAFDKTYHPELIANYDDSLLDETLVSTLDDNYTLILRNFYRGTPSNILSSSTSITGSNCLLLKLAFETTGGWQNLYFTGSQRTIGVYSASFFASSSSPFISWNLMTTGSLDVTPVWGSLDGTVFYLTGTKFTLRPRQATTSFAEVTRYFFSAQLPSTISVGEKRCVRVNIFDYASQQIKLSRIPYEMPSLVIRDVYYQIRNIDKNDVVIPFDSVTNSTRLSSDTMGMWFDLDTTGFVAGYRHCVDIKIITQGYEHVLKSVSPAFIVTD
jgi:hypothetical protein